MSVHAVGSLSLAIRKESSRINKRILKYLPYKDIDQWLQTFLFSEEKCTCRWIKKDFYGFLPFQFGLFKGLNTSATR